MDGFGYVVAREYYFLSVSIVDVDVVVVVIVVIVCEHHAMTPPATINTPENHLSLG